MHIPLEAVFAEQFNSTEESCRNVCHSIDLDAVYDPIGFFLQSENWQAMETCDSLAGKLTSYGDPWRLGKKMCKQVQNIFDNSFIQAESKQHDGHPYLDFLCDFSQRKQDLRRRPEHHHPEVIIRTERLDD